MSNRMKIHQLTEDQAYESAFHFVWLGNRLLLLGVALEIILIVLIACTLPGNQLS